MRQVGADLIMLEMMIEIPRMLAVLEGAETSTLPVWVGIDAHSGQFIDVKWILEGTISPEDYTSASARWLDRNVHIIGGCCGIRPDHMASLGQLVAR